MPRAVPNPGRLLFPLLLLLAAGAAGLWLLRGDPAGRAGGTGVPAAEDVAAEAVEARLEGAPEAGRPPRVEVPTELRLLVWGLLPEQDEAGRLAARVAGDPALVRRLVEWLRPEHDEERMPRPPPGAQVSGTYPFAVLYEALARLGPFARDLLVAALDDEDAGFRHRVIAALAFFGPDAAPAAGRLTEMLRGAREDEALRLQLLVTLGAIGSGACEAAPLFDALLRDARESDRVRAVAAEGFLAVAGPTPRALETCAIALRDGSYEVCTRLLPTIAAEGGAAAPLVGDLLAVAEDPTNHDFVVQAALGALGDLGRADKAVLGLLLERALNERGDDALRGTAARALVRLGADGVEPLLRGLGEAGESSRRLLVPVLGAKDLVGQVGAARLLALLEPLLASAEPEDRKSALLAAAGVEHSAPLVVGFLRRAFSDPEAEVRLAAVWALERVEDDGGVVGTALLDLLGDAAREVRLEALGLLAARSGTDPTQEEPPLRVPDAAIPRLLARLEDPDPEVRMVAARLVVDGAPAHARATLPFWRACLADPERVWEAAQAVERLGPAAAELLPDLRRAREAAKGPYLPGILDRAIARVGG